MLYFIKLVLLLLFQFFHLSLTSPPTSHSINLDYPPCPKCGSYHSIKNGSTHNGKPKRQCKSCGRQFVINSSHKTISLQTKQLIDKLLLERISLRGIQRVTGVSWSWLQNYVNNKYNMPLLPVR
jgi:transposase-like protein